MWPSNLGVDKASIANWEVNASKPEIRYMPGIIKFLGYSPLPEAKTVSEQLARQRTTFGLTQAAAAQEIGVDQARWRSGNEGNVS